MKAQERRLRWYGHVQRRPEDHMVKLALNLPTTTRNRGRPPTTWLTTIQKDLKEIDLDEQDSRNRAVWRIRTRKADPK
ncbi:hypothetical protein RR48_00236 [Papilio machaon]|uniref:Uncharacterized protein n=1 Tax=Papilio machaon TaxID=76193 RepID=A0A0N0PFG7_PAPMA|nr:hypothetical protein RR48_00236 [Papilio machaon]